MRAVAAFVGATALVFALAVAGALASPSGQPDGGVDVTADVPDPESFEAPADDGVAVVVDGDEEASSERAIDADERRDGERFDSVQAAVNAAEPGDTVRLAGTFDERVTVDTANVTLAAAAPSDAVIDGGGEGDVLAVEAANVTVEGAWIRDSGWDADQEDAGVLVNGSDATLRDLRLTEVTFGVWVDGVDRVAIENATIVGRESVASHAERGNGIHLWETEDTVVRDNDVTRVRDGIYFSWAEGVEATGNRLWDLRYGVHYMYSDGNLLADNLAFDNDVGYALMVSEELEIVDNHAIDNRGQSGHGVLIKDVEDSELRGNVLADNENGFYVSNARADVLRDNLVLENDVGVHATAGSVDQTVVGNSFVHNDVQAFSTREDVVAWNASDAGNYWSDARTTDLDGDGVSETRHRPAGTVERLVHDEPAAAAFAESPAFSAVRSAEDSFPVLESPGIVDHRPLTDSPHDYRRYYGGDHSAHRGD